MNQGHASLKQGCFWISLGILLRKMLLFNINSSLPRA